MIDQFVLHHVAVQIAAGIRGEARLQRQQRGRRSAGLFEASQLCEGRTALDRIPDQLR
jgi:hypothetical protein